MSPRLIGLALAIACGAMTGCGGDGGDEGDVLALGETGVVEYRPTSGAR